MVLLETETVQILGTWLTGPDGTILSIDSKPIFLECEISTSNNHPIGQHVYIISLLYAVLGLSFRLDKFLLRDLLGSHVYCAHTSIHRRIARTETGKALSRYAGPQTVATIVGLSKILQSDTGLGARLFQMLLGRVDDKVICANTGNAVRFAQQLTALVGAKMERNEFADQSVQQTQELKIYRGYFGDIREGFETIETSRTNLRYRNSVEICETVAKLQQKVRTLTLQLSRFHELSKKCPNFFELMRKYPRFVAKLNGGRNLVLFTLNAVLKPWYKPDTFNYQFSCSQMEFHSLTNFNGGQAANLFSVVEKRFAMHLHAKGLKAGIKALAGAGFRKQSGDEIITGIPKNHPSLFEGNQIWPGDRGIQYKFRAQGKEEVGLHFTDAKLQLIVASLEEDQAMISEKGLFGSYGLSVDEMNVGKVPPVCLFKIQMGCTILGSPDFVEGVSIRKIENDCWNLLRSSVVVSDQIKRRADGFLIQESESAVHVIEFMESKLSGLQSLVAALQSFHTAILKNLRSTQNRVDKLYTVRGSYRKDAVKATASQLKTLNARQHKSVYVKDFCSKLKANIALFLQQLFKLRRLLLVQCQVDWTMHHQISVSDLVPLLESRHLLSNVVNNNMNTRPKLMAMPAISTATTATTRLLLVTAMTGICELSPQGPPCLVWVSDGGTLSLLMHPFGNGGYTAYKQLLIDAKKETSGFSIKTTTAFDICKELVKCIPNFFGGASKTVTAPPIGKAIEVLCANSPFHIKVDLKKGKSEVLEELIDEIEERIAMDGIDEDGFLGVDVDVADFGTESLTDVEEHIEKDLTTASLHEIDACFCESMILKCLNSMDLGEGEERILTQLEELERLKTDLALRINNVKARKLAQVEATKIRSNSKNDKARYKQLLAPVTAAKVLCRDAEAARDIASFKLNNSTDRFYQCVNDSEWMAVATAEYTAAMGVFFSTSLLVKLTPHFTGLSVALIQLVQTFRSFYSQVLAAYGDGQSYASFIVTGILVFESELTKLPRPTRVSEFKSCLLHLLLYSNTCNLLEIAHRLSNTTEYLSQCLVAPTKNIIEPSVNLHVFVDIHHSACKNGLRNAHDFGILNHFEKGILMAVTEAFEAAGVKPNPLPRSFHARNTQNVSLAKLVFSPIVLDKMKEISPPAAEYFGMLGDMNSAFDASGKPYFQRKSDLIAAKEVLERLFGDLMRDTKTAQKQHYRNQPSDTIYALYINCIMFIKLGEEHERLAGQPIMADFLRFVARYLSSNPNEQVHNNERDVDRHSGTGRLDCSTVEEIRRATQKLNYELELQEMTKEERGFTMPLNNKGRIYDFVEKTGLYFLFDTPNTEASGPATKPKTEQSLALELMAIPTLTARNAARNKDSSKFAVIPWKQTCVDEYMSEKQ
ncbi:hypothetical protein BDR26DRAFT_975839 [Obelidium mucronatum]|nr:hypothetical protein BDR26DRAFT_975839 [Obelidium mucronatum]